MNVLIVDDQQSARTMMRHVVEHLDSSINVADFENPMEALSWSELRPIDLLLLDYRMPGMNGLQFARQFRRATAKRDVPIMMISVVDDGPLRQAALDAGVVEFLVKPVPARELQARCRTLLSLRQLGESFKERVRLLENQVFEGLRDVKEREHEILYHLAKAVDLRDNGTGLHLQRMARFARVIADGLCLSDDEARMIELAAPLHDIGKIGVPDEILLKQDPLTEDEFAVMCKHPRIGFEILHGSQDRLLQLGAVIALRHHERWDGAGFPDGLHGEEIPVSARIVAVADVFDALISDRVYRSAWSHDAAVAFLREQSGRMFDPACVNALLSDMAQVRLIAGVSPHHATADAVRNA